MSRWDRALKQNECSLHSHRRTMAPALSWQLARVFATASAPIDSPQLPPCSHARSLRENRLGPAGAAALAEGLKGNTMLQSLM